MNNYLDLIKTGKYNIGINKIKYAKKIIYIANNYNEKIYKKVLRLQPLGIPLKKIDISSDILKVRLGRNHNILLISI